jgi:hypothetical protein
MNIIRKILKLELCKKEPAVVIRSNMFIGIIESSQPASKNIFVLNDKTNHFLLRYYLFVQK